MIINTIRTTSAPLVKENFDDLLEMYVEPDSNKYVSPLKDKTPEFYTEFLNKKLLQNEASIGFWVVKHTITGAIIGTINLNFLEAIEGHHIGCHLKREYWNQGFATELLTELVSYGFETKCLDKIYGLVEKENHVSKSLLSKIGLRYETNKVLFGKELEVFSKYE